MPVTDPQEVEPIRVTATHHRSEVVVFSFGRCEELSGSFAADHRVMKSPLRRTRYGPSCDKWLRRAEKLAGLEPLKGSLWYAYRMVSR